MAYKKLQIRRGAKANLPTLSEGELGYCTDTKEVYVGSGSGNTQLAKQTDVQNKVDKVSGKGLSANDYTTTDKNKVANLPSNTNTELNKKGNAALIIATNKLVPVSAWASNATYSDFPFRAGIAIAGCTANHKPDVTFSLKDAVSGNYAPIAESYAGGIYIYAAEKPTAALTIPTITLLKEVGA